MGAEPDSLDPAHSLLAEDIFVIPALFEGLTTLNPVTLEPMAGLATHYEANADSTRFTFYLRGHPSPRGMKLPTLDDLPAGLRHGHQAAPAHIPAQWSDGVTITAGDFVYSWKRVVAPETAAPMAPVYFPPLKNANAKKPELLGVRSLGSFAIEVELGAPLAAFPRLLWLPPYAAVPEHAVEAARRQGHESSWTEGGRMVASGPFVLKQWLPRSGIVVRKNPRYYEAQSVELEELVFVGTPDGTTLVNQYKAGLTHAVEGRALPPLFIPALTGSKDVRRAARLATTFLSLNTTRPPLDNVMVRYALNMAIDKERIIRYRGAGDRRAQGFVPPIDGYNRPEQLLINTAGETFDVLSFNPDGARKLLAKALHGAKIQMDLTYSADPSMGKLTEIVQQQWRETLGINAHLNVQEGSVFWSQTCLFRQYTGAVRDSWTLLGKDPYDLLMTLGPAQVTCAGWIDRDYDRMLAAGNALLDPAARLREMSKAEEHLLREMPVLPLYHGVLIALQKPYVRGLDLNAFGQPLFKYAWIDTNWRPQ